MVLLDNSQLESYILHLREGCAHVIPTRAWGLSSRLRIWIKNHGNEEELRLADRPRIESRTTAK